MSKLNIPDAWEEATKPLSDLESIRNEIDAVASRCSSKAMRSRLEVITKMLQTVIDDLYTCDSK